MALRWKGELGDGQVHMTAGEFLDHHMQEQYEKDLSILRKLANNPILSEEVRDTVWKAIETILEKYVWRDRYIVLLNEHKAMKETLKMMNERMKRYGPNT